MDKKIEIMGIVNITDNSYFAESRTLGENGKADLGKVMARVEKMVAEGADIVDIGACSTRPGSDAVPADEEWRRLEPALKEIRRSFPTIPLSIDTYNPEVVEKAYPLIGDFIVNDVTAGIGMHEEDRSFSEPAEEAMLSVVGRLGLRYVAMHTRGNSKTMQSLTRYDDVAGEVLRFFERFALRAEKFAIRDWIIDPGFGFAKTVEQNYELLRALRTFGKFGRPVLVGMSRKSMIYRLFGITPEEALPATQVLNYEALRLGADILRVHDVAETVRTVRLFSLLSASTY